MKPHVTIFDAIDITARLHQHNPESVAAHESIVSHKARLRAAVLNWIESRGAAGATSDECEAATGLSHQSCSARFVEAKAQGLIVPTGDKRRTRSGRLAAVYRRAA